MSSGDTTVRRQSGNRAAGIDMLSSAATEEMRGHLRTTSQALDRTSDLAERALAWPDFRMPPEQARKMLEGIDRTLRSARSLLADSGRIHSGPGAHDPGALRAERRRLQQAIRRLERLRQRLGVRLEADATGAAVDRTRRRRRHHRRQRAERSGTSRASRPRASRRGGETRSSERASNPQTLALRLLRQAEGLSPAQRAMFLEGLQSGRFGRLVDLFRQGIAALPERTAYELLHGANRSEFFARVLGSSFDAVSDERLALFGRASDAEIHLALAIALRQAGVEEADLDTVRDLKGALYDFAGRALEHRARRRLADNLRRYADTLEQRAASAEPVELARTMLTPEGIELVRDAATAGIEGAEELLELIEEAREGGVSEQELLR